MGTKYFSNRLSALGSRLWAIGFGQSAIGFWLLAKKLTSCNLRLATIRYSLFATLTSCLLLLTSFTALAQRPASSYPPNYKPPVAVPMSVMPSDDKAFLENGDSLVIQQLPDGTHIRTIYNNVKFRHKGALMYCNLAIYNVGQNTIEAFGKVKIIQNDTITITGDTLLYFGATRFAKVTGRSVVLKDRKRTLTTTHLDYDMNSGIAYYPNKGKGVDAENTLTSNEGYYDTRTKVFTYYKNVKLVNKKYTLTSDTLVYNAITKMADFRSPTKIVSKDGTLLAKNGSYNTQTGESVFRTRTTIDNPDYTLTGDSLNYDQQTKRGYARGNVELQAKNDKTILNGDYGRYDGIAGRSKVWGHALTRSISEGDTLFMTADTLYSIEIDTLEQKSLVDSTNKSLVVSPRSLVDSIKIKNPTSNVQSQTSNAQRQTSNVKRPTSKETPKEKERPRRLIGVRRVLIYKKDLQSRCDSVIYNTQDSTILFVKNPIIWSSKYQLEADTILVQLARQKIKTMYLKVKSFVISQDSLLNFNQVKGRRIVASFDDSTRLQKVMVDGNGQSIYFAADEAQKAVGMNKVECAKMTLNFEKNQVKRILFVGQPDGKFFPPKDVNEGDKALEGFNWRPKDKPTKEAVLARTHFAVKSLTKNKLSPTNSTIITKNATLRTLKARQILD